MRRIGSRVVSWLVVAAVTAMLSPVSMAFAAVNNNEVTSPKIKEADGTSGQDTNLGSGVKTGHIQDGAVTDAKIAGPISASKIQDGVFQKKNANVVVVAKSGGDFTDLAAAVDSIADASETNRYLVKIMPGVYNTGEVNLKPFVSVEGSGTEATIITNGAIAASIRSYGNSEISNLSLDTFAALPIQIGQNSPTKLKDLNIKTTDIYYAISSYDSIVEADNIKIQINKTGYPVSVSAAIVADGGYSYPSRFTLKNSEITVNGVTGPSSTGVLSWGASIIDIDSSKITINAGQYCIGSA